MKELGNRMKSIVVLGAVAIAMTLSGVARAADAPVAAAPPPPMADPIAAILTPIGDGLNVIVQPVLITPIDAVTTVIAPPAPPPPVAPALMHHHRHHKHHRPA